MLICSHDPLIRMNAEQDRRVSPPRRSVQRAPHVGGSSSASAASPSDSASRQQLSRLALKRLPCSEVCRIAEQSAAANQQKLDALETLLDQGMTAPTKVAVVDLLVNDWGYNHSSVSKTEESVAISQVSFYLRYL